MKNKPVFKKALSILIVAITGLTLASGQAFAADGDKGLTSFQQKEYIDAQIVKINDDGSISYTADPDSGSYLPDYSGVGYKSCKEEIPDVKNVRTIEPGDLEDHTELIQDAIDEVSQKPEKERGAILLKAGVYVVSDQININTSGIVLRGEGQGENGTIIYDGRDEKSNTIVISGSGSYKKVENTASDITDSLVPMGTAEIHVSPDDISKFKAGSSVVITLTPNDNWIKTLGVDQLSGKDVVKWTPDEYIMNYEREITAVEDNAIILDTSVNMTIDKQYMTASVSVVEDDGRISGVGIEDLRLTSYYNSAVSNDEKHGWNAVVTKNCRDCWVSGVSSYHYGYSCVSASSGTRNLTVQYCSFLEPVSKVEGGRRYSFVISGSSYVLIKNCFSSSSRHDYVVQSRVSGPNVFYSCVAYNSNSVSEPHHRWGTGTLYDNVYQIGDTRIGHLEAIMRGNSGTGHGWAGVNTIFWNCLSPGIVVRKPQTEQNFAIGSYGNYGGQISGIKDYKNWFVEPSISPENYPETKTKEGSPLYGNGYIESWYNPVNPSSLYQAQLSYKLTGSAVKNPVPPAPILETPKYDDVFKDSKITFSGICDLNAQKVSLYIDGKKTELTPEKTEDGAGFSKSITLKGGYHRIEISQTVNGIESDPTASRYIHVNNGDEFDIPVKDLQSVLVDLGNEAAVNARNEKMQEFVDKAQQYENDTKTNYDTAVSAIIELEEAINSGNTSGASGAKTDIDYCVQKIGYDLEYNIRANVQAADEYGCDREIMETINGCLKQCETYYENAKILATRAEREITNNKVDEMTYEEELEMLSGSSDSPALVIVIVAATVAITAATAATAIVIKKKKNNSAKAEEAATETEDGSSAEDNGENT